MCSVDIRHFGNLCGLYSDFLNIRGLFVYNGSPNDLQIKGVHHPIGAPPFSYSRNQLRTPITFCVNRAVFSSALDKVLRIAIKTLIRISIHEMFLFLLMFIHF